MVTFAPVAAGLTQSLLVFCIAITALVATAVVVGFFAYGTSHKTNDPQAMHRKAVS